MKAWMCSNFGKFAIELRPLINVRIEFAQYYIRRLLSTDLLQCYCDDVSDDVITPKAIRLDQLANLYSVILW